MSDEIKWIVIPGGPGLSNNYLKYALSRTSIKGNLLFYDMYGSPESDNKNPNIDEMIDQIGQVACENKLNKYGLITHSFGNYIAMRALKEDKGSIEAIIMLSPMPFEFHAWKSALAKIVAKIPEPIIKEMLSLSEVKDPHVGTKLFRQLFPYYIGRKGANLPIDVSLDMGVCNTIVEKVSEYDDKNLIVSTSVPIVRIVGELDIFFCDRDILSERTLIIPYVGHYPFFEDPDSFYKAVKDAIKLLFQKIKKEGQ